MRSAPQQDVRSPTLHAFIGFLCFVFVAIVAMSCIFKVEIVSQGVGILVPMQRVQVVQPEIGGQITAIHVRDGMRVTAGDTVVELDATDARVSLNKTQAEIERLEIERRRIETVLLALRETDHLQPPHPAQLIQTFEALAPHSQAEYFRDQTSLLRAELIEIHDAIAQTKAQIDANDKSKDVSRASIERIDVALETQMERLETANDLLENGTSSRTSYLDVLDDFNDLGKQKEVLLQELELKDAQDTNHLAEGAATLSVLRSRLQTRRTELHAQSITLSEELIAAKRRLANTSLVAPISGTVDQLSIHTIGGIVESGQILLRIVPIDQDFEVEATFMNNDIGFLEFGQDANIKLDAYPSERFGALRGQVSHVSADAIETAEGEFGFLVRIQPLSSKLETTANSYPLQPGMTSMVDVITGERRLISYFFAPILKTLENSLGER